MHGRKRCGLHGGKTPRGPDSPHWKDGRYATAFQGELKEKYIAASALKDPTDILPELATQRAVFASFVGRLEEGRKLTSAEIDSMMRWSETIGKMAERVVKMRNETMLTVQETQFLQAGIIGLLNEYVDQDRRGAFIAALYDLIPRRLEVGIIVDG